MTNDLTSFVAGTLAQRIASGDYPPETKLPGVRQLADELGVSVTTLRTAIASLEEALLLETRPREGTIVRDPMLYGGVRAWALLMRHPEKNTAWLRLWLGDIIGMMHSLVVGVVRELAAMHTDPRLSATVDQFAEEVRSASGDRERLVGALFDLFRRVLSLTGHPAHIGMLNEAYVVFSQHPVLGTLVSAEPEAMIFRWRAVQALLPVLNEDFEVRLVQILSEEKAVALRIFDEMAARAMSAQ